MNLNNLVYYWKEALTSLYRNGWLSLASIGTIVISLLILGSSLLVMLNVRQLAAQVESSIEISVFLADDLTDEEIEVLGERLASLRGVKTVTFISREQALKELQESFEDNREALAGLEKKNTLPNSFRIKADKTSLVPSLAKRIESFSGVDKVRYGRGVVEKLLNISSWVRYIGLVAVVLLGVAAVSLIATTIRMSVFARRQEIGIMKILGATNWFIRAPFMLEGMLLGLAGGLIAAVVIYFGYHSLVMRINASLPFLQLINDPLTLRYTLSGLVTLGFLIGALGSAISVRRFLKV